MSEPLEFEIQKFKGEQFEFTIPIPLDRSFWPFPDGSYLEANLHCKFRQDDILVLTTKEPHQYRGNVVLMHMQYEPQNSALYVGVFATKEVTNSLSRDLPYELSIRLVRPRGASPPRIDAIALGTIYVN